MASDPSEDVIEASVQTRIAALERDFADARRQLGAQKSAVSLLNAVIDNSTAVIYAKDAEGRYLMINRHFEKLFGVTRDAMMGKTDYDLFTPEDAEQLRKVDRHVLTHGELVEVEESVLHSDKVHTYISIKCPLFDEHGTPHAICGISTDITQRKAAEKRAQSQLDSMDLLRRITRAIADRQDLRSIFGTVLSTLEEQMPLAFAAICLYDATTQTLTLDRLGLRTHELQVQSGLLEGMQIPLDSRCITRSVRGELVYDPDIGGNAGSGFLQRLVAAGVQSLIAAPLLVESSVFGVLVSGRTGKNSFGANECDFLRQLSEHVALATNQAQLYEALRRAYEDLRKSQQAILQQERLRALGQMASGVAHDINNAISPVALYTESLLERGNLDDAARDALMIIQRAIGDVAKTVVRMREFSRPRETELHLARINLNDLVLQVIDLTRVRWRDQPQASGHVITVYADLAAELPAILGADSEIRDALINMVFNAVDAMPQGGALTIRTACLLNSPGGEYRERESVWLEVTDTGVGMSEEARRHCLEPFYSTKGERGTGLGLAMVYGMVQRHNADLQIDSEPDKGTTIRVRFATLGMHVKAASAPHQPTRGMPRRILVVDDDPLIIHAMETTLVADGHCIVTANGGREAIEAFVAACNSASPFDVVITDLGMPHVDGRQVAAAVKAADPMVKVIMLTGWGQRLLDDNAVPAHVDRVMTKPPTLADLRTALAIEASISDAGSTPT